MRATRSRITVIVSLASLVLGQAMLAQDKKKDSEKKVPIAPAEAAKEGWDEIDQRLIFLMIRLANTETSLEAVEKTIAATSRTQSVRIGDAKRAVRDNDKMDRKGGGPVHWSVFYGRTADKFFLSPDRSEFDVSHGDSVEPTTAAERQQDSGRCWSAVAPRLTDSPATSTIRLHLSGKSRSEGTGRG